MLIGSDKNISWYTIYEDAPQWYLGEVGWNCSSFGFKHFDDVANTISVMFKSREQFGSLDQASTSDNNIIINPYPWEITSTKDLVSSYVNINLLKHYELKLLAIVRESAPQTPDENPDAILLMDCISFFGYVHNRRMHYSS